MKQRLVPFRRPCMSVPFLFLVVSFVFLPIFNFKTSKQRLVILYKGTIIYVYVYIYMHVHVHCFPPPTPCVILFKLYNMPFLFLPFKKTLKLLLINTIARTVPWVNRPLNFGKNKNKTYCSEKSKIKNIFPISP